MVFIIMLFLFSNRRRHVLTRVDIMTGGRMKNLCQVFLKGLIFFKKDYRLIG